MRLLPALIAFLLVPAAAHAETAYDRIMRTGEIRCGYFNYAPAFMTDPNSGARSGIMSDVFSELGTALNLKIKWAQEINLGTFLEDLNAGRYDLECAGGWPNANRGKYVAYSHPLFFAPVYAYVRADDHRFDNNYAALNAADVRLTTIDGEYTDTLRTRRFPLSINVGLPQGAHLAELAANVITGKADLLITDRGSFLAYDKAQPGTLRQVSGPPVSITTFNISIPGGDFRLQQMLNTAIDELQHDGVIDRILDKYEPAPGTYLRVAPPYAQPKE